MNLETSGVDAAAAKLARASISVRKAGPELSDIDQDQLATAAAVHGAYANYLKKMEEAELAHSLAMLCSENVPAAVLSVYFQSRDVAFINLVLADTSDGGVPRFGGFADDDIDRADDELRHQTSYRFLHYQDTAYKVTAQMSSRLFCDGDYRAFLNAASRRAV